VVADVGGRPLLRFMLDRLATLVVDQLVIATSDDTRDDPIAAVAADAGVPVVRGPEHDVLRRFVLALEAHPAERVVRLTADCPLADPALAADVLALAERRGADYASNAIVRTFPDGLDVEVIAAHALRTADAEATDASEREHVTPFIYRHPERFALAVLLNDEPLGAERWTVDTAADLERVRAIVARLPDPVRAGWREILEVTDRQAPAAGLSLRPALAGDEAAARRARPLEDPSLRTWVAAVAGHTVGWAEVTIADGTGLLVVDAPVEHRAAIEAAVEQLVAADPQITRVTTASPG
jgi:spore coat polysaccharide biosynthesis protein SpsF